MITTEVILNITEEKKYLQMIHTIMELYSPKTSINKFKEQGEGEFTKELAQLTFQDTFLMVDATKLTNKQLQEAVASLMFLKDKYNGDIKGQA